jgi:hypothetical protein
MEIKKIVDLDSLTEEEKIALDSGEKTEEDLLVEHEAKEKGDLLKKEEELKKAKEIAENQKIRAEKAEAESKKAKEGKDNLTPKQELSQSDLLTLARTDVAEEDIKDVIDYANFKKISVKEALESGVIKSLLAERGEERKTAEATATKQKRTGATTQLGSDLLGKAESKGELPEDKEGMEKLVNARFSRKSANK